MAYTYGSSSYCNTYNNTAENKYSARLGWELQSQDKINNTSTFKITLEAKSNNSSYYTYGKQTTTINGVTLSQASFTCKTSWITLGTRTITITHNSDGSFPATTISGSFVTNVKETYCLTGGSASVTIATASITKIDRESTFTLSGSTLGSAVSVAITRQNDLFTHKVEYSFAGSSYTTATSSATTSASFTPALSLASNIPNATSGILTVRVTTFNGETQIGSPVSKTLTLSLPDSVKPTVNSVTITRSSTNTTVNGWGIYVKGYSKATIAISATGSYGSEIKSYSVSGGGFSTSGTTTSYTTGVLNVSGTVTFTVTVTDSRGRTASKTESISVVDYSRPSITVTAGRSTSTGNVSNTGTYLRVFPTYSFSPVSNGTVNKNSATVTVTCNNVSKTNPNSGEAFVLAANVSAAASYTLTATITDSLGNSATATVDIPNTEALPLHIKGNKKGVGLGMAATTDSTIEIGWAVDLNNNNISGGKTITATTFSGALSGNASTATTLATARTIRTNLASTSTASFNGSSNITPGVTGTLALGNGGTGATTAESARTNLVVPHCPVGTVVITSTNAAPSNVGTWELIDKEFTPQYITSGNFTINTTNTTDAYLEVSLGGHGISIKLGTTNKTAITDTALDRGTIKLSAIGVTALPCEKRMIVGASDGANAWSLWNIATNGVISTMDCDPKNTSVAAGNYNYTYADYTVHDHTLMLDSFCNKFYWKRTA